MYKESADARRIERGCCCSWLSRTETKAIIDSTQAGVRPSVGRAHSSIHFLVGRGFGFGQRTARIASSKTVLRPFCVSAEHSKYFTAPISFAIAKPCQHQQRTLTPASRQRRLWLLTKKMKSNLSTLSSSSFFFAGWVISPALRPYMIGPMCNPDIQNLLRGLCKPQERSPMQ